MCYSDEPEIRLGKYMIAQLCERKPKTAVYDIVSVRHVKLGQIKWYSPWRQYCFFPEIETLYNSVCMQELVKFLLALNTAKRKGAES